MVRFRVDGVEHYGQRLGVNLQGPLGDKGNKLEDEPHYGRMAPHL